MYCPHCGSLNSDASRFCQHCGGVLTVTAPLASAPAPPAQFAASTSPRSHGGLWLGLLVLVAIGVVAFTAIYVANQNDALDVAVTDQPQMAVLNNVDARSIPVTAPTSTPLAAAMATPRPSDTPTPLPTSTPEPTATSTPTPCPDSSPYSLNIEQMRQLGCPTQGFVTGRVAVLQRFEKGVMIVFAKPINTFDNQGGASIYALANDGRAWRMTDTYIESSPERRTWYTCDAKSNDGPEVTGVPWRGFGKAWCTYSEVKQALGKVRTGEEGNLTTSFQSYENGRAFQVSDWRGFPGWSNRRVYIVYLPTSEGDYRAGTWEAQ